ncbi:MAG: ATP:cob(I)alamin adenosyltransferase [Berkelbacteria bacterium GW2011_GWA2_46_7]|uniref:Corrinoid adenosyltransferase n=1 Tax=Berkelbacteria bacterium GW2011_GWA2_46_7 TaxID=1618335 RepID=A0A0G1TCA8_9BACT|nr:MAG: ATP:cob(I)alamin adenosyltransferase [Berkelbacteria bacterium GW2011_GWA2_46_7]
MPIYTKKGDRGETGLPGGRRFVKTEVVFECLGALDQVNATIGLAVSTINKKTERELISFLVQLQSDLLSIGSLIAADKPSDNSPILAALGRKVTRMEIQIDDWDSKLPELKNFILPGGSQSASIMHLARVSTRQAERTFHRLPIKTHLEPVAVFLNRLSDFFFQCARYLNLRSRIADSIWRISDNLS